MKRICIITSRHISYNPRVLKEADALFNSGHQVTVLAFTNNDLQKTFDDELMIRRGWELKTIKFRRSVKNEKFLWLLLAIHQKLFNMLAGISLKFGIAERILNRAYLPMKKLAFGVKADLYIAHHPESLAIASMAATRNSGKFAYDAEDFHVGMSHEKSNDIETLAIAHVERKYLSSTFYTSAASEGIARIYAETYSIAKPLVIDNVFPNETVKISENRNKPLRFYWYSQVIGPNRNLEYLVKAASLIKNDLFEIHLRGSFASAEFENDFKKLVLESNLQSQFNYHAPILADLIINDASQYDVGLALESANTINHDLCVANKVFAYIMAGLAVIGTDTSGQKNIFQQFDGAALICDMYNEASLAEAMIYLIENRDALHEMRKQALNVAATRFNWESESEKLLKIINSSAVNNGKKYEVSRNLVV